MLAKNMLIALSLQLYITCLCSSIDNVVTLAFLHSMRVYLRAYAIDQMVYLKIFSLKDIEKATHNFDSDHLICSSTHRKVYEGSIEDLRVSIKAPAPLLEPHPKLIDRCSTEAATAIVVMNHSNMAKLYGCYLENFIPILVYEFLPNGSLFEHLHGDISSTHRIKWVDRLKVATDTAYALAYMHNALSKPVVHRDINSYIILLEYSFHAKLSKFGCSVPITPGDKSQR